MTRVFKNARKVRTAQVRGLSVVTRNAAGAATVRTFRNRYTLRRFLSSLAG